MLRAVASHARSRCRPLREDSCHWASSNGSYPISSNSLLLPSRLQRNPKMSGTNFTAFSHLSKIFCSETSDQSHLLKNCDGSSLQEKRLDLSIERPSLLRLSVHGRNLWDLRQGHGRSEIRWFSMDSKNNGKTDLTNQKGSDILEDQSRETVNEHLRHSLSAAESKNTKAGATGKSERRDNAIAEEAGMLAVLFGILVAPIAIDRMRSSDNTYEDIDPEDPVADLAKFVRSHFNVTEEGKKLSSALALDSLLSELLRSKQLQDAVSNLVAQVIQSPEFKRSCQILLKELWTDLINDPETTAQVIHLLNNAIQDEQIKEAAVQLVMDVVNDKDVLDELTALLQRLGNEPKVQDATQALLVESAHNALNDPEILDHSMEFATDVVGDDVVQRTAGEALYNAVSYAVRPTLPILFSVVGAGLIVLSVVAFSKALAPADSQLEQAMESSFRYFESSAEFLFKVSSVPVHILTALRDAVVAIVILPFRLVRGSVRGIGRAGSTIVQTAANVLDWIIRLPGNLFRSIISLLGNGMSKLSSAFAEGYRRAGSSLSNSIFGALVGSIATIISDVANAISANVVSLELALRQGVSAVDAMTKSVIKVGAESLAKLFAAIQFSKLAIHRTLAGTERAWLLFLDNLLQLELAAGTATRRLSESLVQAYDIGQEQWDIILKKLSESLAAMGTVGQDITGMIKQLLASSSSDGTSKL